MTQAQRAARNTKPIVVPAPPRRTASDFATPVFSIRKVKRSEHGLT